MNGKDDDDARELEKKATLAEETFEASFRTRLASMPTLLSSMPFDKAVETLTGWASLLLPRQKGKETFRTVAACSSRLRELTSETNDSCLSDQGTRTSWPFIQKLQVHLKAHILGKGLIIADLPGLRDLNSARRAITERYVRQCHQILVVAKIDRAVTDQSIKEVFELASRVQLSRIDIVCTRSEEIHMKEAQHDWPNDRETIEELQERIDSYSEEIQSLKDDIKEYDQDFAELCQDEMRQLVQLQQECLRAEQSKSRHEFQLLSLIVGLRNGKVSTGLQQRYQSGSATVVAPSVFCVSNKLYWENREKPAASALPYLRLSGILELRRYCIGIVAQSRLDATRAFIRDEIPAFLGSVELWVEAGAGNASAERKQQILDAVAAIQRELNEVCRLVDSEAKLHC
ncbi:hypothetical protein N0V94_008631 [Neodidymelliopsis sp. IMI 364377]|nr:hypothetical protein N0V94_008631 [Neodidymelliopsis sp. IMI 364377]